MTTCDLFSPSGARTSEAEEALREMAKIVAVNIHFGRDCALPPEIEAAAPPLLIEVPASSRAPRARLWIWIPPGADCR